MGDKSGLAGESVAEGTARLSEMGAREIELLERCEDASGAGLTGEVACRVRVGIPGCDGFGEISLWELFRRLGLGSSPDEGGGIVALPSMIAGKTFCDGGTGGYIEGCCCWLGYMN